MTDVVEATALRRTFGARVALEGVDLRVAQGDFLAIMGPSGSGKSTLLGIIGGLDTSYQGSLKLFGQATSVLSDRELSLLRGKRIGFVFQAFFLLEHQSVLDNVLVPSLFVPRTDAKTAALQALDRVGLADRAADRVDTLSGGQRQRVAIARAIAHQPSMLLCDEPTGNLDKETASRIVEIFASLHREGTTVICATHEDRLAEVATTTLRLSEGRVSKEQAS
ncbi:MAG: ABC transporter ATP-binding protein [Deltaproteobacteria bacterium]|nr:ABC transporter ATP-binding protein [Deltaproteobacteria bacterium]